MKRTYTFTVHIDDSLFHLPGVDMEEVIQREKQAVQAYWDRQVKVFRENGDLKVQNSKMAQALEVCRKTFRAQRDDERGCARGPHDPPPWELRRWAEESINEALRDYKEPFR